MELFTTTSHDEIRTWIDSRGGHPAVERGGKRLRIDFGSHEPNVRRITWDEFFRHFDSKNMQFVYQNAEPDGSTSRYYRVLDPGDDPQT